jgi:diguanylate cyclase (GGDEF)-like protein/PAS domain S-box-containing protein
MHETPVTASRAMKPLDHRQFRSAGEKRRKALLTSAPEDDDFRNILDSIPQMVWAHLPDRPDHEYYNRRWHEFTGAELAPDGSTRRGLIHADDVERAVATWEQSRNSGENYECIYRLRHHTGEYRWLLSRGRPERSADGHILRWYGTCTDIHDHVLARNALHQSETLNSTIIQASADMIEMLDLDGTILFANQAALEAIGADAPSALLGQLWVDTLPEESRPLALAALSQAFTGRPARFTTIRHNLTGENEWRDFSVTPVKDDDGKVSSLVISARDVTDERMAQERLRWTASHDALTRLPNRAYFHDCLEEAIRQAKWDNRRVGLLILDVDKLKQINDALGHDAGDGLICAFAQRLKRAVADCDVVGRLGGDEFGVLLMGIDGPEGVAAAADRILERLREPFIHDGRLLDCRGSIGASVFPDQGHHRAELMKQADLALYVAKSGGGAQWVIFDPAMRAELQTRASMLALTRDALREDRILPYYQPKIDLASGAIHGFEALLRWRDASGRIHLPGTIAAAFEDNEVALEVSERILGCAIADMRRWLDRGVDFGHVAINVSAVDFRSGHFAARLLERLATAEIATSCVQIEVTETVFLGRGAECVETALKQLNAAGVTIALDDFGTGYASLSHLKRFPVDVLKIDQSFVRDLESDPDDAAIIRSVIRMSKSLDIAVVAEGIETRSQERFLIEQGCEYGQGYLFAKAVPAERVPGLVAKNAPGAARTLAAG